MGLGDEAARAAAGDADALSREICLPRDAAGARVRLAAYSDAGADLPVVYPVATSLHDPAASVASVASTLRSLAP